MHNSPYKPPQTLPSTTHLPCHPGGPSQGPRNPRVRILRSAAVRAKLPEPHSLANGSLLCALLARLLGAGRALTRRLERRPLDGGNALLEACRARPRERGRIGKGLVGHLRLAQARFRVVVDGGAEAAREQPIAASLARLALAARGRQACALRRLNDGLRRDGGGGQEGADCKRGRGRTAPIGELLVINGRGTGSVVRSASTLPFILMVTTSGTVAGGGGWMGGEKQGSAWVNGVVGGAGDGVSGGGAEGTRLVVALSSAKNDSAATGAKSVCSSANDAARFAESVSTS